MLSDSIPFVRLQAVITLGRLKIVSAVPWLVKMLKTDRNFKIRSAVVTSLGHIGDKSGLATLQGALRDRDSRVRANAVEALEEVLQAASIPILRSMLSDPDNRTRSNVTKALFRQGDVEVIRDLENMLAGKEISTKISGAYAVGQIGIALREIEKSPLQDPLKSALEKVKPPQEVKKETEEISNEVLVQKKVMPVAEITETDAESEKIEPLKNENLSIPDEEPVSKSDKADKINSTENLKTKEPVITAPPDKDKLRNDFIELARQGKLKESLRLAMKYIDRYPHDLMANFFIGNLNFQLSRFEDSIKWFSIVIEQDPFHIQAHSNIGVACYRSGKINEAIEHFKNTLKLKPDLSVIRFNLASLYLKTNKWAEAYRQFEEGLRYSAPTAKVLTNMAFACQKIGNFEKAIDCYQKAIKLAAKDAGIYYNWAILLTRLGKKKEALEVVRKALRAVDPSSPGLKNLRNLAERLAG
jgi:tetratricopeptide (TPR) repeat protein